MEHAHVVCLSATQCGLRDHHCHARDHVEPQEAEVADEEQDRDQRLRNEAADECGGARRWKSMVVVVPRAMSSLATELIAAHRMTATSRPMIPMGN